MSLYWLCYRHNNQISVVIEPGASLIHARLRAALANLDQGEFTEGHELDRKWRVPKEMVVARGSEAVVGQVGVKPLRMEECMSSEHFGQFAWQFERMSGSSGLKVQAAIAC
jgi:hypothetical protein